MMSHEKKKARKEGSREAKKSGSKEEKKARKGAKKREQSIDLILIVMIVIAAFGSVSCRREPQSKGSNGACNLIY